uniref:Uncharacterized protein n=1 Tax=Glossina pallidipes TaxID=7398 RepID=A0A1A9Z0T8_GLOPL
MLSEITMQIVHKHGPSVFLSVSTSIHLPVNSTQIQVFRQPVSLSIGLSMRRCARYLARVLVKRSAQRGVAIKLRELKKDNYKPGITSLNLECVSSLGIGYMKENRSMNIFRGNS